TALGTIGANSYLYSTNFAAGRIDVLPGDANAPPLAGNFTDPNLPSGFAPFNIQNLGGTLFVTSAGGAPARRSPSAPWQAPSGSGTSGTASSTPSIRRRVRRSVR